MFVWTWLACANPSDSDVDPVPYVVEQPPRGKPALTLDDIAAGIDDAIATALNFDAAPPIAAYDAVVAGADTSCPQGYEASPGYTYWGGQCTSESGTTFSGFAYDGRLDDQVDANGTVTDWRSVYVVAKITDASGQRLESAAGAVIQHGVGPWGAYLTSYVSGEFSYEGDAAAGSWLADTAHPEMSLYLVSYDGVGAGLWVSGSVSRLDGPVEAYAFSALNLYYANACALEPAGTILLRDEEGYWYDVVYDTPLAQLPDMDPALCDGCGEVWYQGELLGEVCNDFSPWYDWRADGGW